MLMPREGTQSRTGLGRDCHHSHVCCGPAANTLGPNPQDPWGTLPPPRRGHLQSRHSPSSFEPSSRTACRAPGTVLDAGFRVTHKHTSACAHGVCIRAGKTKTESEGSSRPRPRARGQRSASGEITSAPRRQSRLPGRSAAWQRASRPPPPCSPAAAGRTRSGAGQRDEGHTGAQRPSSPEASPARSVRSSDATRPSSRPSQHPHTLSSCPT